jgi:hypothetical protein
MSVAVSDILTLNIWTKSVKVPHSKSPLGQVTVVDFSSSSNATDPLHRVSFLGFH